VLSVKLIIFVPLVTGWIKSKVKTQSVHLQFGKQVLWKTKRSVKCKKKIVEASFIKYLVICSGKSVAPV
jgi:hypothetical protein